MAAKTSSLLDDADFSSIGKSKQEREKGSRGAGGNGLKIAVVIGCFVVAGLGLAWNFGVFEPKQVPSSKPGGKGALSTAEQEAAKQQELQRKEDLKKPDITPAGG